MLFRQALIQFAEKNGVTKAAIYHHFRTKEEVVEAVLAPGIQAIERIVRTYVDQREVNEGFLDTFQRIGLEPFKASVYSREVVA